MSLIDRPDDWRSATDTEICEELSRPKKFVDPAFINYVLHFRPNCMRRYLILHEQMGGYVGAPARRWLRGEKR